MNLQQEILNLKKEKNAVLLAHYYQESEIQNVADFVGDSLDLSRKAAQTEADIIVFCGVHFMAETAKIVNPYKKVLLPDLNAGCSLADSCDPHDFRKFREQNPDHYVISYINCSAEIKAQSDLICTSSNAVKLVSQVPENRPILFAPDRNLGRWVSEQAGRKMTLWNGSCQVHENFSEERFMEIWLANPGCEVIAHPECEESLLRLSDFVGSTSSLLRRVAQSSAETFIVLTEPGILHEMRKVAPGKTFLEVPGRDGCNCNSCPYMRLNTLEKLRNCLRDGNPEITLEEDLRQQALKPLELMLALS